MKASTGERGKKSLYTENQWTCALFIPSSQQLPLAWITAQLLRSSVLICCSGKSADSSLDFSWRYGRNSSVLLGSVASISISRQTSSIGTDPERESCQPLVCTAFCLRQTRRRDYFFMPENLLGKCRAQVEVKWCLQLERRLQVGLRIVWFSLGSSNFVKNLYVTYK